MCCGIRLKRVVILYSLKKTRVKPQYCITDVAKHLNCDIIKSNHLEKQSLKMLFCLLLLLCSILHTKQHGRYVISPPLILEYLCCRMMEPPSRASMWRVGFPTPKVRLITIKQPGSYDCLWLYYCISSRNIYPDQNRIFMLIGLQGYKSLYFRMRMTMHSTAVVLVFNISIMVAGVGSVEILGMLLQGVNLTCYICA